MNNHCRVLSSMFEMMLFMAIATSFVCLQCSRHIRSCQHQFILRHIGTIQMLLLLLLCISPRANDRKKKNAG